MLFQAKMSSYPASYDEFYNTGSLFIVSNVLNWHQFFTLKIKATFSCYTFFSGESDSLFAPTPENGLIE